MSIMLTRDYRTLLQSLQMVEILVQNYQNVRNSNSSFPQLSQWYNLPHSATDSNFHVYCNCHLRNLDGLGGGVVVDLEDRLLVDASTGQRQLTEPQIAVSFDHLRA